MTNTAIANKCFPYIRACQYLPIQGVYLFVDKVRIIFFKTHFPLLVSIKAPFDRNACSPLHSNKQKCFNSNALGWTDVQDWNKLVILPDGLWKIQQSIDPNDCIYRDYNHFRIVNLKKKILCYVSEQLDSSSPNCNIDSDWYADIFFNLQLLESAKYMAECCDYTQQATILYNQVEIWFKRYGCESGC